VCVFVSVCGRVERERDRVSSSSASPTAASRLCRVPEREGKKRDSVCEREMERETGCVCVCVKERERGRVCVCVCARA